MEVTGADKLTYIEFSQGTAQMFYGMSKRTSFFEERLNRYIAFAPVIYGNNFGQTYEGYSMLYPALLDEGIYYLGGDDWDEKYSQICENLEPWICASYSWVSDYFERNSLISETWFT